jgi:hypothetical protein
MEFKFSIGKDTYTIEPQRTKQFHFLALILFYGFKNGKYVSGTTSGTGEESYSLLMDIIKKETS